MGELMALFQPGQPKTGGRARGVKNRLSHAFLIALAEDFEQHGAEAIKICRMEAQRVSSSHCPFNAERIGNHG
jgi:hypothetical protein